MPTGLHDKRVEIQQRGGTADAMGNVVPVWTTLATVWGSLQDSNGRELFRARQVDPTIGAVVILRQRYTGLGPQHRLLIDSRVFDIRSVAGGSDRGPREGQVIHCNEDIPQ